MDEADVTVSTICTKLVVARSFASESKDEDKKMIVDNTRSEFLLEESTHVRLHPFQKQIQT